MRNNIRVGSAFLVCIINRRKREKRHEKTA